MSVHSHYFSSFLNNLTHRAAVDGSNGDRICVKRSTVAPAETNCVMTSIAVLVHRNRWGSAIRLELMDNDGVFELFNQ